MTNRIALSRTAPRLYQALCALDESVQLEPQLQELVRICASQLNGCAYCVDMHATDAKAGGESDRRIWAVAVWRETPFFSERERAALALTEALTLLPQTGVPDDVYDAAAGAFSEEELGNLYGTIIAINAWNRVGAGTCMQPHAESEEAAA